MALLGCLTIPLHCLLLVLRGPRCLVAGRKPRSKPRLRGPGRLLCDKISPLPCSLVLFRSHWPSSARAGIAMLHRPVLPIAKSFHMPFVRLLCLSCQLGRLRCSFGFGLLLLFAFAFVLRFFEIRAF